GAVRTTGLEGRVMRYSSIGPGGALNGGADILGRLYRVTKHRAHMLFLSEATCAVPRILPFINLRPRHPCPLPAPGGCGAWWAGSGRAGGPAWFDWGAWACP